MDAITEFKRRAAPLTDAGYEVPAISEVPGREGYGWIDFEGLPNTRDLGGLPAADGRLIKRRLLLRSGALGFGSEADLVRLREDYSLQLVVDLRNDDELAELPDPMDCFPGARFLHANILTAETVGITQEKAARERARLEREAGNPDPAQFMELLYPHLLLEDTGIAGYRAFLQAVLACENGVALWHCYVGRDRCGMASALMEALLGVPRELMETDYLATNVYAPRELTNEGAASLRSFRAAAAAVEREFGGFMGYINKALGITPDEVHDLRERYLERA